MKHHTPVHRAGRRPQLTVAFAAALLGCSPLLGGCLSLGSEPIEIQHYLLAPHPGEAAPTDRASRTAGASVPASSPARGAQAPPLRFPPVRGPAYLSERIVWRRSDHEAGYYEDRRWLERPESTLERAVSRQLFEVRGLPLSTFGGAHRLEVTLNAFEEVLEPHVAWVSAQMVLTDPRGAALLVQTVEARHPIQGDDGDAIAAAMEASVREVAEQIADRVAGVLEGRAARSEEPDRGT